jgi:hypothetical protein
VLAHPPPHEIHATDLAEPREQERRADRLGLGYFSGRLSCPLYAWVSLLGTFSAGTSSDSSIDQSTPTRTSIPRLTEEVTVQ